MREEELEIFKSDYVPKATISHLEAFLVSTVWTDMRDILEGCVVDMRSGLEKVSGEELLLLQGKVAAYRELLTIPEAMLTELKTKAEEREDD